MMHNQKEMTITLKRIEVCDLLIACLSAQQSANDGGKKWEKLHEELKNQLRDFDEEEGWSL